MLAHPTSVHHHGAVCVHTTHAATARTHRRSGVACTQSVPRVQARAFPVNESQMLQGNELYQTDMFARALKGKSFLCTECGKCCTGSGEVWISTAEAERIAGHLDLALHVFYEQYTKSYYNYEGWRMLKAQKNETLDCIFLKDKLCTIHPVRPSQCSTYPWWPELMSREGWNREKEEICEGFDHPDAKPLDSETLPLAAEQLRKSMKDLQVRQMSHKKYAKKSEPLDELANTVQELEEQQTSTSEQPLQ